MLSSEVEPQLIQTKPCTKRDNNKNQSRGTYKWHEQYKKYNSTSWKNRKESELQTKNLSPLFEGPIRSSKFWSTCINIGALFSSHFDTTPTMMCHPHLQWLEKQELWAQSCEILNHIVDELDSTDAHSYLACGKLKIELMVETFLVIRLPNEEDGRKMVVARRINPSLASALAFLATKPRRTWSWWTRMTKKGAKPAKFTIHDEKLAFYSCIRC